MSADENNYDVVVIGAGAAGFMTAIQAGKRGRKVLLIDSSNKIGEKIRISGGGRCNFTNLYAGPENYISNNPHFCKSALAGFTPQDFIAWVEQYHVPYHEKKLGQLFCDNKSTEIINILFQEAKKNHIEILKGCHIEKIKHEDNIFYLTDESETYYKSQSLVIATGGLSIPQIGASDFGYRIAKQFGLNIIEPKPALVPLVFKNWGFFSRLAGLSFDAIVSCKEISFRENILFTHKGLSGPAILQISSYLAANESLTINLSPALKLKDYLIKNKSSGKKLKTILKNIDYQSDALSKINRHKLLPDNFIDEWSWPVDMDNNIAEYANKDLEGIATSLEAWQLTPSSTEGFNKAEVTRGGVDTNELNSKTMEAKKIPGLYFVGEVVDVTGWLGGYNFQWAWASGFAAGQNC